MIQGCRWHWPAHRTIGIRYELSGLSIALANNGPVNGCGYAAVKESKECYLYRMETITTAPVMLTPGAISELKRLMAEPGFDESKFLRIGVKGGGCSGMSYVLGFDEKQANDEIYENGGIRYIMNPAHGLYLFGMQVDWQNGLNARGFTFTNPNASKTCGCGSSFAV